jgi:hypothetical protein
LTLGYLVPGDPLPGGGHIPAGIGPTPLNNFSPRFGLAYSPSSSDGYLSKLTGGPGKTSIRLGGGRIFTLPHRLTVAYRTGNPPYGLTYTGLESPVMETLFIGALTGTHYVQQFPVRSFVQRVANKPRQCGSNGTAITPTSGAGSVYSKNKTSYVMQYNFTVERQVGDNAVFSIGYMGSLGRHLIDGS